MSYPTLKQLGEVTRRMAMKVYKAEEIKKFRDSATRGVSDNLLCTTTSRIHDVDGFKIGYFDFDGKKWYGDEHGDTILNVKYFVELPNVDEFNNAIEEIEAKEIAEKTKKLQEATKLLKKAVGEIDGGIFLKEEIFEFLGEAK